MAKIIKKLHEKGFLINNNIVEIKLNPNINNKKHLLLIFNEVTDCDLEISIRLNIAQLTMEIEYKSIKDTSLYSYDGYYSKIFLNDILLSNEFSILDKDIYYKYDESYLKKFNAITLP